MKVMVAQDRGDELPPELLPEPSPLKHDVDDVISTWLQHKLHHVYPHAGGYFDQDEDLMRDWHTLNLYYSRVANGQLTTFDMSQFRASGRAWSEMAGE